MSEDQSTENREEPPYPPGPEDEHTEFLDAPAPPDDENAAAGAGVGEGATAGADDPDATADEAVGEQAGSKRAEIARPPRGAPQPNP